MPAEWTKWTPNHKTGNIIILAPVCSVSNAVLLNYTLRLEISMQRFKEIISYILCKLEAKCV